jgi:hypothetical protein
MTSTAGAYPSSRRCHQFLLLGSPVSEQLEQVVRGRDQLPLTVNFLQTPQQKPPQAPAFLDLAATGSTIAFRGQVLPERKASIWGTQALLWRCNANDQVRGTAGCR